MTPHAEVAITFASALIEGNFSRAESLLTPELRRSLSREVLRESFYTMFRSYTDGEPRRIRFDEEFQKEEWPTKVPGDIGWVYVGIEGDDFVEAVRVVVAEIGGRPLIREVEWGRP